MNGRTPDERGPEDSEHHSGRANGSNHPMRGCPTLIWLQTIICSSCDERLKCKGCLCENQIVESNAGKSLKESDERCWHDGMPQRISLGCTSFLKRIFISPRRVSSDNFERSGLDAKPQMRLIALYMLNQCTGWHGGATCSVCFNSAALAST